MSSPSTDQVATDEAASSAEPVSPDEPVSSDEPASPETVPSDETVSEPVPAQAVPDEVAPSDEAVPTQAVPEDAESAEAVPERTESAEAVPAQAVPEDAQPEATVAAAAEPDEAVDADESIAAAPSTEGLRVVIVTGLAGAGRSTAANALEDIGWYLVDNLPPSLLIDVCQLARQASQTRLAVVLDVRTRSFFEQLPTMFSDLGRAGIQPEIVYLEASDEVIVRRQESARRPHPLQGNGRLMDGITRERASLATLRAAADLVIDTSSLNVHQLGTRINHAFGGTDHDRLRVTVMSFGFKNGIPIDADLVLDVRFLTNPHWIPALRPQTGLSREVSDYVLNSPGAEEFIDQLEKMLTVIGDGYIREGKRFVTVAIGCTGGKHRSTAIAEELARRLRDEGRVTNVLHRDLGRE